MKRFLILLMIVPLLLMGCRSFYRVTDLGTSQNYHTRKFKRTNSGAIVFEDGNSGAQVTLQNSSVERISSDSYQKSIRK